MTINATTKTDRATIEYLDTVGFGAGQSCGRRRSAIAAAGRREGRGSVPCRLVVERGGTSVAGALDGRDASEPLVALAAQAEQPSCLVAKLVEISIRVGPGVEAPRFDWHVPSLGKKPVERQLVIRLARK